MTVPNRPDSALVIVGHGSTVNPDSAAPTWRRVDTLRQWGAFAEVYAAFWKEEPGLSDILPLVLSDEIYVVPNFIGEGYFTRTVIPRELGLEGAVTRRPKKGGGVRTIRYCEPVGSHPSMTERLLRRAEESAPDALPERTCLLIVGHGTGMNENSAAAVKNQVSRIRGLNRYAEVRAAFMEEAPFVADWHTATAQPNVVAVPFFVADGLHSAEDIPWLLGIEPSGEGTRRNPHRLRGRTLYYGSAVSGGPGGESATDRDLAQIVLDQVDAFDARHPEAAASNAPDAGSEIQARLCALYNEVAGFDRIGEIAVCRADGRFILTHREDAAGDDLERFASPEDARQIAKFDAAGRYRPLKTAPNLRRGWRLELTGNEQLAAAIDFFYPGATRAWRAYRLGGIDPVPLRSTLERQSGMYAIAQTLDDHAACRTAASCCRSGTGCLKTILWPRLAGLAAGIEGLPPEKFDPSSVPARTLPLLCREACHTLVAACRRALTP